ncbi:hypothetical protein DGG96_10220 [Legionella qingyii]|uniref:Uncharacterized protein n=1 Tax=Legionella qingyii TaxID=2184757 RepID=A0A317U5B0_9GAMM|nr:hypothetical protein [Legionella qingyii]PWY54483.1 hypothetical protein DGG96_16740 [Legionella qingyii]PWY55662.1 hypothetical protein DGG96_10220 [Legionella qingyii]RUR21670.1 hypothetical protein ELY20_11995 [Legionella qingyii]RUR25062.1 hypothetical protein ELY16_10375 [Legionella qingyii]
MSEKNVPEELKIEKLLDKLSPEAKAAVKDLVDRGSSNSSYVLCSLEMMKKRVLKENSLTDQIPTSYEDKYSDNYYSDSGNYSDKSYSDTHYGDKGGYNDNYNDIVAKLTSDNNLSDDNDLNYSNTKFKP